MRENIKLDGNIKKRGGDMAKYCPKCDMERPEDEFFCGECNTPLSEKPSTSKEPIDDKGSANQYYEQFFEDTRHHYRKSRAIIALGVIAVVALLISFSLWIVFVNQDASQEVTKYYARNDGPTVSLQSSSTGNVYPIPEPGYYATYGYYYQNNRIGEATTERVGDEIYQGINCFKTKTSGNMDITISGGVIKCTFEIMEYRDMDNSVPVFITTDYQYQKPFQFTQSGEISWDQENGEMVYTTSSMGQTSTAVSHFPDEIWELYDFGENMIVGYSKNLTYTMDIEPYTDIEVNLTLSIIGIEDVSVQNGDYEDCYIIEMLQEYQILGIDQKMTYTIWVNAEGIMPQQEITLPSIGSDNTILLKLDEYYTTEPPEGYEVA